VGQSFCKGADRLVVVADDGAHLGVDALQVVLADVVQLLRRQVGRGVLASQDGVDLLAVGDRPDAGLGAGRVLLAQEVQQAAEGRVDRIDDRAQHLVGLRGVDLRQRRGEW
jgi:hypothetical protein